MIREIQEPSRAVSEVNQKLVNFLNYLLNELDANAVRNSKY